MSNEKDTIYRQDAIDEIEYELEMINSALDSITLDFNARERLRQRRGEAREILNSIQQLPSAQPFHNITMNDVLKYIDGMPEDVWQEFTACLECRGWELQRKTAKWCGSEFA